VPVDAPHAGDQHLPGANPVMGLSSVLDHADLLDLLVAMLPFTDVVLGMLRVSCTCSRAASRRIVQCRKLWRPLLSAPFMLRPCDLLHSPTKQTLQGLDDDDLVAFSMACTTGAMAQCTWLTVQAAQIGCAGIGAFASAITRGALPQLKHLWLYTNRIDDAGVEALAEAALDRALEKLEVLQLTGNAIGDAAKEALAFACGSGSMPELKRLFIDSPSGDLKARCLAQRIKINKSC